MNFPPGSFNSELHKASPSISSVQSTPAASHSVAALAEQHWFSEASLANGLPISTINFENQTVFESVDHAVESIVERLFPG